MAKVSSKNILAGIADVLYNDELDYLALKDALEKFKELCLDADEMDLEDQANSQNVHLESGKAIGPKWAIMCVDDLMRTKRFTAGVQKAVSEKLAVKETAPVEILYAGSGPFATLVLPLIGRYTPTEVQFTLLEVNPRSYQHVLGLFERLGLEAYLKAAHLCDATQYQITPSEQYDIVVVECLQHTLAREPQVEICCNLMSQLPGETVLIPEEINLYPALMDFGKRQEVMMGQSQDSRAAFCKSQPTVFTINKETISGWDLVQLQRDKRFSVVETPFPEVESRYDMLVIGTEIRVYKDEVLDMDESGLTMPRVIGQLNGTARPKALRSIYVLGADPVLETELIR